ncbi:hypothetical protein CGLO_13762 [Colletotrichum gloeosporioides Cg-14]|uniref:Uncharacterized protein n=1 Tax=Colletotrichum gloeosporioides (strain Cg-14) TaxID=1237896 RepID=T0LFT8_COLGC|nr:hypothetical protein CGLO_13762 [Colletotrichum gloeosporioides Cg-14]
MLAFQNTPKIFT